MDNAMTALQAGIEARQSELHDAALTIAMAAKRRTSRSNGFKIATVLLGALTAAKGTFDVIFGAGNHWSLGVFTVLGIAISACAGIEATFKYEKVGAELTLLAATGHAAVRWLDTEWRNTIGSDGEADPLEAARRLLTAADEKLAAIQEGAAKLGVNITLQVYKLDGPRYRDIVAA